MNLVGKVGSIPKDINAKKGHYKARYLQIAKKQSKLRTKSIIVANLDGGELMLLLPLCFQIKTFFGSQNLCSH